MRFSDIPGQQEIKAGLVKTVDQGRVSHAQLFAGPEGCGSFAVSLAYAQFISCENRLPSDSCGKCKSCLKYEKLIHPDLHFVFPVIKDKKTKEQVSDNYISEWREFVGQSPFFSLNNWLDFIEVGNAQGLIFASEASEIIRKLMLKTFESDYKILILWLPEKMHIATANKLLKMIEEPPEKTLFLLVSEEPDKIIPTIASRCQMVKVPSFRLSDIAGYLQSNFGIGDKQANDIARVANGNIVRAVEMCKNQDTTVLNLDRFKNLMRFAWKRDIISIISWSEEMASIGREPQKNFLSFALRLVRENFMLTLGQGKNNIVYLTDDETAFSSKFHPFINQKNVHGFSEELNLAHAHVEANGNAKIIFLDLALKLTRLIRQ
ncbi:MAG TPA: DNA polymerase III subunit delta [Bacteroidales bacterium]|nr:DNA polymerase III subunit delta [Bacteroidales bacterium]HNR40931.1 DNA polymerase III subunit delta [Bacteroidales bacterium]HPM18051.1 DNA polymerase III subunit delta [Bacteroidales bacterium]